MPNIKIAKVTHFYPKIGVAILDLSAKLNVNDVVMFTGSTEFSQVVTSMQIEHESVSSAQKGQTIGLKVDQPVKPGDEVLKS